ncbi:hypothetical protein NG799_24185 [Laspinema sp. D1]|uniref:Beta-ketoacyl synthase N-terminal domain-containing protein n=1 Tax=Laspinema palackyanum D2a TaxID=2953684 RepID=A0ABT2MZJ3_9CYAN|nr:hypothetical protein [Laspinema sp. D2a]
MYLTGNRKDIPKPQAIFIGGGLTTPNLGETFWRSLGPGDRRVANAATVDRQQMLFQHQGKQGGTLTRCTIHRAEAVCIFLGWKVIAAVTQWVGVKE